MKKITLVGDSLFARKNRGGKNVFEERLRTLFPDIIVKNLSEGGANSVNTLQKITFYDFPSEETILISLGMNDCAYWKLISIKDFVSNLGKILTHLKNKNLILITPQPVNLRKQKPPGRTNRDVSRYSKVIIEIARRQKLRYLDLNGIIGAEMKKEDVHDTDGVHLNGRGYDIFTDKLFKIL